MSKSNNNKDAVDLFQPIISRINVKMKVLCNVLPMLIEDEQLLTKAFDLFNKIERGLDEYVKIGAPYLLETYSKEIQEALDGLNTLGEEPEPPDDPSDGPFSSQEPEEPEGFMDYPDMD